MIFHVFALPLLRLLGGEPADAAFAPRRSVAAELAAPLSSLVGREDYAADRAHDAPPTARCSRHPVAGGSGDIVGFVRADGLVRIAAEDRRAARRRRPSSSTLIV